MTPRFCAFWAINAPLDQERLHRQLDQYRDTGFDGVVWHPRFYPGEPPYLSKGYFAELSGAILHARSIGLAFWIYDEDGWPSGTVGGQLLKQYPDDAQRWAEIVTEKTERTLAEFEHEGKRWFLAERVGAGADYFNPEFTRHFIEMTHEAYRAGLKPEAWEHVKAIFSDEPEFGLGHAYDSLSRHGAIPWTPRLPKLFRKRHGEDLFPLIPQIFFPGDSVAEVRIKFWELLTDIFNQSFTAPIDEWCRENGKLFTAHLKGEEHPLFQVPTNGSCHQFFRHLSLPAIDALERYPSNNFYPRQVSSAARQFGSGRSMVEAFGGAGWGATPEDLEHYVLWLGRHGLTDFVMHLSQYRLDSAAMHDWPPSQPLHLTWREAYPELLRRVRRELESNPRGAADTLVIAPNRGVMANHEPWEFLQTNVQNAATYPDTPAGRINRRFMEQVEALHRAGVNYDIADERTVEEFGQRAGDTLVLGKCRYRRVIVGEGCRLSDSARAMLKPFAAGTTAEPVEVDVNEKRVRSENGTHHHIQWALEAHPTNLLLLECADAGNGWFTAPISSDGPMPDPSLELVFADDIAEASLNGKTLAVSGTDEGSVASVESELVQAVNTLRFRTVNPRVQRPFVWLRGLFRVTSPDPSGFVAGPNHTVKTEGPFTVRPQRETIQRNLIADGFPFLRESLVLTGTITLDHAASALLLNGVEAAAFRLQVGESDLGWTWRKNGGVRFEVNLPTGTHRLRLELVPNTFNSFGPHHYCGGDWHVVSSDQIKGVRNFADPPDAPAHTHVSAWHFRPFRLPDSLTVENHE